MIQARVERKSGSSLVTIGSRRLEPEVRRISRKLSRLDARRYSSNVCDLREKEPATYEK
jgi:hypothetical protein